MKTTTASRDPEAFARLKELVHDIDIAMMTTVTPDGALRSRPMVTREFANDGVIWFFTSDASGKAHDLEAEKAVNLSYADPKTQRYVSVTGNAHVVHDPQRARELWGASVKAYFPRGLDDPHLALIRVHVETAEYWDLSSNRITQLFKPAKHAHDADRKSGEERGDHTRVDIRRTPASG